MVRVPSLTGFVPVYFSSGSSDPKKGETIELKDEHGNRKHGEIIAHHWIVGEDSLATLYVEIKEKP